MAQYIVRRLLQFIPVFFGVTLMLFLLANYLPGADAVQLKVGERALSPEVREQFRQRYGLDKPWYEQYVDYLSDMARGDWGESIRTGRPVTEIMKDGYPWTMRLAFAVIVLEVILGVGIGIISATRQYSALDVSSTLVSAVFVSLPVFWVAVLLQYTFGIWLKNLTHGAIYLPVSGATGPPFPDFAYLILPAVTMGIVSAAYAARLTRSELLEVLNQDYIQTAYAKGLSRRQVLWGHAMKNALIPVVTFIGLDLGALLGGAVLIETLFNWPGVGYEVFRASMEKDIPVVVGGTTVLLVAMMLVNLLVDVSYAFLDPRIRYGSESR